MSPGLSEKMYEEAIPGLTSMKPLRSGLNGGVAIRTVSMNTCANGVYRVLTLEVEHLELLPRGQIFVTNERLVEVLAVVDAVESRYLDLSIRAGKEVHVGSGRQLHLEFLDEGGYVLVAYDGTLVLLYTEDRLVDMDFHVALHLALASQTPVVLDFLAREVWLLAVEYLTPQADGRKMPFSLRVVISDEP